MMLRSLIAAVLVCVLQAAAAAHPIHPVAVPVMMTDAAPFAREDAMRVVTVALPQVRSDTATSRGNSPRRYGVEARSSSGVDTTLIALARSQIGAGAVYGRHSLWCARFLNWALERSGFHGTRSDLARSFLALPHTSPHVGAIAVLGRGRRSGHVGIVTGFDARGNPIIVSGNHGHRVGEGAYPRQRVIAYVSPA